MKEGHVFLNAELPQPINWIKGDDWSCVHPENWGRFPCLTNMF